MPDAAAPSRSLCSAMRLRSRQVSCRIGSIPCSTSIAAARDGAEMRPRTGAVGDVDRIGKALQWQRLCQEFGTVGGHRRSHFRGDYKSLGAQLVLQSVMASNPSRKIQWTLQVKQWEKWWRL